MQDADIESRPLWKPMHLQPVYSDRPSFVSGASESLFLHGLSMPSGSSGSSGTTDEAGAPIHRRTKLLP